MENKKIIVAGYYDSEMDLSNRFEGCTPYGNDINVYTIEEALKLGFIESMLDDFNSENEVSFSDLKQEVQLKLIYDYCIDDEIAGMNYFKSEEEAMNDLIATKREILEGLIKILNQQNFEDNNNRFVDDEWYWRDDKRDPLLKMHVEIMTLDELTKEIDNLKDLI